MHSAHLRAFAIIVSAAVALGSLTIAAPAAADDDPAAPVVTEPSSAPSTDPEDGPDAGEPVPTEAPEPDATDAPEPSAAPEESEESDAGEATESVTYTGRITRLSEQDLSEVVESDVQLFRVAGKGLLRVDVSRLDLGTALLEKQTLRLAVPAGLELSTDPRERFSQLATAAVESPLVALGTATTVSAQSRTAGAATADLVNQTPATAATHQIFAVLVTPSNGPSSAAENQTAAKVQTSVAHADDYWKQQSSGSVRFTLEGTVPWYQSTHACTTSDDTYAIWDEAAGLAETQLGFEGAGNQHLVLFFPNGDDDLCGGAAGRGTIGSYVNDGGYSWVIGTDAPIEQAALAHELGHNLSLGHANWLECDTADPHPGFLGDEGCVAHGYGDLVDTMGFGMDGYTGGALSSPGAIRSGIWTSSAYSVAPKGTTSYTLNAVSSNSGKRAVVVEDKDGVNYFVEFRNFTGEDAQYAGLGGCDDDSCVASGPSVRVLRLEQQVFLDEDDQPFWAFKGYSGDDSLLVGRTVSGSDRVSYLAGESFNSRVSGDNGITVKVDSISSTTAKVTITKRDASLRDSYVAVEVLDAYDYPNLHVGDVLSALLFADWTASSYKFQWYRAGTSSVTAISGATKQYYTVTGSDLGKYLYVIATASSSSGSVSTVLPDPWTSDGMGPVLAGVMDTGTIAINASSYPFSAVLKGWTTPGVTYKYQWYRDGSAISGATSGSYTPTASDAGTDLSVRVNATKSGFGSQTALSPAADYTLNALGTLAISGTAKVGQTVSLNALDYTKEQPTSGTPVPSPNLTIQWFRSGATISGAVGSSYTLVSADYGKTITASVTASTAGTMRHVAKATLAGSVVKGTIAGDLVAPVVTTDNSNPSTLKLIASHPADSIDELGTKTAWQWYRGTSAVKGATSASYSLTSADYGKTLSVRATVTKSNYETVVRTSTPTNYSITASGTLAIGGVLKVGQVLTPSVLGYATTSGPVAPTLSYQWYRSGVKISGATAETYRLTSSDYGQTMRVAVTARVAGFQPLVKKSASTATIRTGTIAGTLSAPVVNRAEDSLVLTSELPEFSVTETGVTVKRQWYRGSTAVSGKTGATYTLTSADRGKQVWVKYTLSKSRFATVVRSSTPYSYTLQPAAAPWIMGVAQVGQPLTAVTPAYESDFGAEDPTLHYQWYVAGLPVGTDDFQYTPVAGDLGKKVTVKITPVVANLLTVSATSAATAPVIAP